MYHTDVLMSHLTCDSLFGLLIDTNNNIKMYTVRIIGNIGHYLYWIKVFFKSLGKNQYLTWNSVEYVKSLFVYFGNKSKLQNKEKNPAVKH